MRMDETQLEATRIWKMLLPNILGLIEDRTKACLRMKKLTIVTPPNGTTMGVMQPNDDTHTIFNIPYLSGLSNAQIGQVVFVVYWYGMTNAIAIALLDNSNPYQSLLVGDVDGMIISSLQEYTMDNFAF